jgi:hypothetical protein
MGWGELRLAPPLLGFCERPGRPGMDSSDLTTVITLLLRLDREPETLDLLVAVVPYSDLP